MGIGIVSILLASLGAYPANIKVSDPNILYSPYNWYVSGSEFAQTPNPGAYFKMGFTGTSLKVGIDVSPLTGAKVPSVQYPVVRYSVDNGPATTKQLTPTTTELDCAKGLKPGNHTLLVEYVAGYVFLDFWTPINVMKITGFTLDQDGATVEIEGRKRRALFLGDSITNGDDNIATFEGGITNAVDTQDATIGYPSVVAAATNAEYGVVAYGGASWDATAADGNTPGLMTFWDKIDKDHSRLVNGKFNPIPDDIYVNMGENRPPKPDDVSKLVEALVDASSYQTNIFLIVPFSGRAQEEIFRGYSRVADFIGRGATRIYFIDLGKNPYLQSQGPTLFSVDGQHPNATLHGQLGAQIVAARAKHIGKGN